MELETAYTFSATIEIIGINPFVFVPNEILKSIFEKQLNPKALFPLKALSILFLTLRL